MTASMSEPQKVTANAWTGFLAPFRGEIAGQVFRRVKTDNLLAVAGIRKVDKKHLV
ncbi:MAG: hypothetical protein IPH27_05490 [Actinomycetales bacterium]|nr:hypothetical protein [Candidatus Phosphoribacter baldrii]